MKYLLLVTFILFYNILYPQVPGILTPGFKAKATATGGQALYTTPGTYTWVCPAGVTSVCVVCVGGGGAGPRYSTTHGAWGGAGGGLGWKNNISVTPGNSYTVVVGSGGVGSMYGPAVTAGTESYFISNTTVCGKGGAKGGISGGYAYGGGYVGDGGGNGGTTGYYYYDEYSDYFTGGGGGAGGYSGAGGAAAWSWSVDGAAGSGGGGGGGGYGGWNYIGGGGGGVGLFGQGASGAGGYGQIFDGTAGGRGGSGGANGQPGLYQTTPNGGNYGGGGGVVSDYSYRYTSGSGGSGAVRIIWGAGRAFPSTNVANETN